MYGGMRAGEEHPHRRAGRAICLLCPTGTCTCLFVCACVCVHVTRSLFVPLQTAMIIDMLVQASSDLETHFVSVERVGEYSTIQSEVRGLESTALSEVRGLESTALSSQR